MNLFKNPAFIVGCAIACGYIILLLLLIAGLGSQGRTLDDFATGTSGDAWEYAALAHTLLERGSFSIFPSEAPAPEFFRTPGYPLFATGVLAVNNSTFALILAQIFLVAATAALIVLIGERLFSLGVGVVASVLFALESTTMMTAFMTLSDVLFTFLLVVCLYLASVARFPLLWRAFSLGVIGGYAALVRPLGLYVLPLFVIWFAWEVWRDSGRVRATALPALLLCAGTLLVLVPWGVRNVQVGGEFALSTAGPYNALFYNFGEFLSQKGGDRALVDAELKSRVGTQDSVELRSMTQAGSIQKVLGELFWAQPAEYALFHLQKTIPYFFASSIEQNLRILHQKGLLKEGSEAVDANITSLLMQGQYMTAIRALAGNPWGLLERFAWLCLFLFALAGVVLARGNTRAACIFLTCIVLALAVLTGPVSFPRYRLPAEPFLFLAAVGAASLVIPKLRYTSSI